MGRRSGPFQGTRTSECRRVGGAAAHCNAAPRSVTAGGGGGRGGRSEVPRFWILDHRQVARQRDGDCGSGDDTRKIQISAPVHQGNSGGPALDQFGNVIGVIQSKQVAFASGDIPQNVNVAIKSMIALNFLEANGVEPPITVRTTDPMDGAAIAEKARDSTVQVVCR